MALPVSLCSECLKADTQTLIQFVVASMFHTSAIDHFREVHKFNAKDSSVIDNRFVPDKTGGHMEFTARNI